MADLNSIIGAFDANNVQPASSGGSYVNLPAGFYVVTVTASDLNDNGAKAGLKMTYEVLEGKFKGGKVGGYINLKNPGVKCVEIGMAQLSAWCHATGVMNPTNTEQLHGIPFVARVKLGNPSPEMENGVPKYPAKGEISGWIPRDAESTQKAQATDGENMQVQAAAPATPAPAQTQAATPAPATGKAPWVK